MEDSTVVPSKPKRTIDAVPWDKIKEEYLSDPSIDLSALAGRHSIGYDRLRKHANRNRWAAARGTERSKPLAQSVRKQVIARVTEEVSKQTSDLVQHWVAKQLRVADKGLSRAETILEAEDLAPDDLKTTLGAAQIATQMGRQGLGLDKDDPAQDRAVRVQVLGDLHMMQLIPPNQSTSQGGTT